MRGQASHGAQRRGGLSRGARAAAGARAVCRVRGGAGAGLGGVCIWWARELASLIAFHWQHWSGAEEACVMRRMGFARTFQAQLAHPSWRHTALACAAGDSGVRSVCCSSTSLGACSRTYQFLLTSGREGNILGSADATAVPLVQQTRLWGRSEQVGCNAPGLRILLRRQARAAGRAAMRAFRIAWMVYGVQLAA